MSTTTKAVESKSGGGGASAPVTAEGAGAVKALVSSPLWWAGELAGLGVPAPESAVVSDAAGVAREAMRLGFPVCIRDAAGREVQCATLKLAVEAGAAALRGGAALVQRVVEQDDYSEEEAADVSVRLEGGAFTASDPALLMRSYEKALARAAAALKGRGPLVMTWRFGRVSGGSETPRWWCVGVAPA